MASCSICVTCASDACCWQEKRNGRIRLDLRCAAETIIQHGAGRPPRLRLAGPEHGWIDLVVGEEGGGFSPVTLSDVYPPLADLWAWSLAVAWG